MLQRRIMMIVLSCLLLIFLAACGNSSNNGDNAASNNGNAAPAATPDPEPEPEPEPVDEEPPAEEPPAPEPAGSEGLVTEAAKGTPVIDGKIDDIWGTARMISTDRWVQGSSGSTAKVWTLWDEGHLYVLAEVTDSLLTKKSANVWEQDSIEIFVDQNNAKAGAYDSDDGQYRINFDNEVSLNPGTLTNLTSATAKTDTGYIVEAAIAWIGTPPNEGDTIGFDVQVNNDENDDGVRDSTAIWNDSSGQSYQDTSNLGSLILGPAGPQITTALKGTPEIDGKIDDKWNNANVITTERWVQGSDGATAKVRTLWDEKYLYVLAEVTDNLLTKKSANVWEQDSIEIFVDENNGKSSTYQSDDGQYRINFDNEVSVNPGNFESNLVSAAAKTNNGYIIEAAIAWNSITPQEGTVIGFDIQVNDDSNDDGVRDNVSIWEDTTGQSYQNMSKIGLLKLGGSN